MTATRLFFIPLIVLLMLSCGCRCPPRPPESRVRITEPAPNGVGGPDEMGTIRGVVSGVDPNDVKVLIYAHAGDRWWIQPLEDAPFTTVNSDGQWQARIHLGYEYAALLVHRSYSSSSPPKQPPDLPEVGGCIWAIEVKAGRT